MWRIMGLVLLGIFSRVAVAETVHLKDGSVIKGTLKAGNPEMIQLDTPDGVLTIQRNRIVSIEYDASAGVASPGAPVVAPASAPATAPQALVSTAPAAMPAAVPPVLPQAVSSQTVSPPGFTRLREKPRPELAPELWLEGGYRVENSEVEGGVTAAATYMAPVADNSMLGLSIGYSSFNNKVKTLSAGDVQLIPIEARLMLKDLTAPKDELQLFFLVGAGYCSISHSLNSSVTNALATLNLVGKEEISGSFVGEAAAGLALPDAGLRLLVGYQILRPTATATVRNIITGAQASNSAEVDMSAVFLKAVIAF